MAPMTNEKMRAMSGEISDGRGLVKFLYLLMRDVMPVTFIEESISKCESDWHADKPCDFTNGWLARYAQNLADRLDAMQPDAGDDCGDEVIEGGAIQSTEGHGD